MVPSLPPGLYPLPTDLVQSTLPDFRSKQRASKAGSVPLPSANRVADKKTRSLNTMGVDAEGPLSSCTHLTPFFRLKETG